MQDIRKDVHFVMSQIIEEVCKQKSNVEKRKIQINRPLTPIRADRFSLKTENPESRVMLKVFLGQFEKLSENFYSKSLLESELQLKGFPSFFSKTDLCHNIINEKFNPTQNDSNQSKQADYFKTSNGSWNAYSASHSNRTNELKDVFVQTIFCTPTTVDSQCQCDLLPTDNSTISLVQNAEKKKIKLNTYCYSYMSYGKSCLQFQNELSHAGPLETTTNSPDDHKPMELLKSASRIRIGLSKRFKTRHPHKR